MKKLKVIIIHGAYGYPDENWFGWMKRKLRADGIICWVPQFPTPHGQSLLRWLNLFNKYYGTLIDSDTILIGHSLGAAFILRWLEQKLAQPKEVILVGAFIGEVGIKQFDSINQDFFSQTFDWQTIRKQSKKFICYHGNNDPYVTQECFEYIVHQLAAKKIIVSNAGHFNAASGYKKFPHLWIHLQQLREQVKC